MTKATLMLASEGTGTESLLPVLSILTLAALALFAAEVFKKWLNPIVSLLLAGVFAATVGPQGFNLLPWIPGVDEFANWGVTLLMFIIGMEFRLDRLAKMWRVVVLGGILQMLSVTMVVCLALRLLGSGWGEALFWGALLSMSSTALVVKVLELRGEAETPAGRGSFALLSAQDIAVLPLMLLIPVLAPSGGGHGSDQTATSMAITLLSMAKSVVVLLLLFFGGKFGFNLLIRKSAYTRNRALMLAVLGVICAGSAYLMKLAGLSPALGALVAGLLVSRSEFAESIRASAAAFRDFLAPLFFLAIGMLINLSELRQSYWMVALLVPVILVLKSACGAIAALLSGYKTRDAVRIGVLTAQIGELSFVLVLDGVHFGLVTPSQHQLFVALAVISMALTPLWVSIGVRFSKRLPDRAAPLHLFSAVLEAKPEAIAEMSQHVVIAGGGLIGRMCVRFCEAQKIPCLLIEANPHNVERINQKGQKRQVPFIHGDCRDPEILLMAQVQRARAVVIAISHESAALEALAAVRDIAPGLPVLAKTRLLDDVSRVKTAGASQVVPEDLAAGIEANRMLAQLLGLASPPRARPADQASEVEK